MKDSAVNSPHILVADDEKEIRELVALYLIREGYKVDTAASGAEVLKLIRACEYRLFILDIVMPGPDGIELCRHIRTFSDAPILMLTARDSERDKVLGLTIGADDYMT